MSLKNKILILALLVLIGGVIFLLIYKKPIKIEPTQIAPENGNNNFNPVLLDWQEVKTSTIWSGRDSAAVIVFKGKIWVMGGVDGTKRLISPGNVDYGNAPHFSDIWSSKNGKDWELVLESAPWGGRRSAQITVFKNKLWLMGGWGPQLGYKNDVWSSVDGSKWVLETNSADWAAREGHQVVIFKDKLWLIGGVKYNSGKLFTDVWSSTDGVNWDQEIKDGGWPAKWDFGVATFKDKLWLIGGMDLSDNLYKDVWSSENGKDWVLVNNNPPFLPRQGASVMEYKNKLWVIGRLNTAEYGGGANDVWYTEDGVSWEKTKTNPIWTGREDSGAIVFNDKICILGGMDLNWQWRNDIWCSK